MADPLYSAGARADRAATRKMLEGRIRVLGGDPKFPVNDSDNAAVVELKGRLKWVRTRQSRYDKRPGGL
jgi:hypothetical protein